MRATVSGFMSEGVPPPKKMLVTVAAGMRAAQWAISAREGREKALLVHRLVANMAVEVAIGAFGGAERPVHIHTKARIPRRMFDHGRLWQVPREPSRAACPHR